VHAVTINGKRYLNNEKPAPDVKAVEVKNADKPEAEVDKSGPVRRTKAEVEALIDKLGREPPDWFEETQLNYPKTLDLSWPIGKPEGAWDNQKNVGQYYWDVINPNPNKWREGVKLMHELRQMHKDDPAKRQRASQDLGRLYHDLLEDYARAAFWWRAAGIDKNPSDNARISTGLAECYWRLGNKQMAVELLKRQEDRGKGRVFSIFGLKLWADMGDLAHAVDIAEVYARQPGSGADVAFLHVGDGFRQAGKTKEALAWYERVLALPAPAKPNGNFDRSKTRARASIEAIKLFDLADVKRVADGTYEAASQGYEAPVKVAVTVKGGKIEQVRIVEHREKQFYSALTDTPAKIIAKQGVKGVDATSSATITSEAVINASAKALSSGSR
jgi:uncharacterized protein with FMN-binding domain